MIAIIENTPIIMPDKVNAALNLLAFNVLMEIDINSESGKVFISD